MLERMLFALFNQPACYFYTCSHLCAEASVGRYGQPSDAAGLALFLAAPASAHVTGSHIPLDGGGRYRPPTLPPSANL